MKKFFLFIGTIAIALSMAEAGASACTSVIVSGKATKDGRPLMWKNRDTSSDENVLQHFTAKDGCYSFLAVVKSGKGSAKSVWMGTNSKGFSIMNTLSYNVRPLEDTLSGGNNGVLMRRALEICTTVEDFQNMLDTLPRPLRVATNYGVIDACGGAAYFETNNQEYFKYDVNDPEVAPEGYLVRTNFSFNGAPMVNGKGQIRFQEANRQMEIARKSRSINPEFILREMSRDYCNPATGVDYKSRHHESEWAYELDIITRYKSTCSIVIQGVRANENPQLTTMWTIIGYPGTTPALPTWEAAGNEGLSYLLKKGDDGFSPLSHHGWNLKKKLYCYDLDSDPDHVEKYFKWDLLWNNSGDGYLQRTLACEKRIMKIYKPFLASWRKDGSIDMAELKAANAKAEESLAGFMALE